MTTPNGASNAGWENPLSCKNTGVLKKFGSTRNPNANGPPLIPVAVAPAPAAAAPAATAPVAIAPTAVPVAGCANRSCRYGIENRIVQHAVPRYRKEILIHPLGQQSESPNEQKYRERECNVNRQSRRCGECERSKNSGGQSARLLWIGILANHPHIPKRQKTNQACHQSHHMVRNPDQRVCPRRNLHRVPPFHVCRDSVGSKLIDGRYDIQSSDGDESNSDYGLSPQILCNSEKVPKIQRNQCGQ